MKYACPTCGRASSHRYCEQHRAAAEQATKDRWRPGRGTKEHEEIRQAVFERDGWRCVICGSTENLEAGHIVPHRDGGAFTPENLQAECRSCNRKKGADG